MIFDLLRIPFDFIAVILAAFLAYFIRPLTDLLPFVQIPFPEVQLMPLDQFFQFAIVSGITFIFLAMVNDLYHLTNNQGRFKELVKLSISVLFLMMSVIAFYALFKVETFFSRGVLLMMGVFTLILSYVFRLILNQFERFFLKKGIGVRRVALWGEEHLRHEIILEIENSIQYSLVYSSNHFNEKSIDPKNIDEMWFIKSENNDEGREILEYAQINHLKYRFIPDVFGVLHAKLEEDTIGKFPLLKIQATSLDGWGRIFKRVFDIVLSLMLLVILSPFLIFISILIKLNSKGPIFYISDRVGKNGETFKMYKFRSMVVDADEKKKDLQDKNHRKDTPLFKVKNDPRVTKFGKFLRRYSIDELPQIFNVLFGNMSFVGPRPHLPNEVKKYLLDQRRVLMIKPGITGLSQITGRSNLDFSEEIKLDLHYIVNWSLLLDFKIILKTPFVLLKGEGAD